MKKQLYRQLQLFLLSFKSLFNIRESKKNLNLQSTKEWGKEEFSSMTSKKTLFIIQRKRLLLPTPGAKTHTK